MGVPKSMLCSSTAVFSRWLGTIIIPAWTRHSSNFRRHKKYWRILRRRIILVCKITHCELMAPINQAMSTARGTHETVVWSWLNTPQWVITGQIHTQSGQILPWFSTRNFHRVRSKRNLYPGQYPRSTRSKN